MFYCLYVIVLFQRENIGEKGIEVDSFSISFLDGQRVSNGTKTGDQDRAGGLGQTNFMTWNGKFNQVYVDYADLISYQAISYQAYQLSAIK